MSIWAFNSVCGKVIARSISDELRAASWNLLVELVVFPRRFGVFALAFALGGWRLTPFAFPFSAFVALGG